MSEPVVITLRHPITFGSRTVTEIVIRPVKAKHLRRISDADSSLTTTLNLASWLSGEVKEVIDELEGEDLAKVVGCVNDFLFAIQRTGPASSGS